MAGAITGNPWTPSEDQIIIDSIDSKVKDLLTLLPNRSFDAVKKRRQKLRAQQSPTVLNHEIITRIYNKEDAAVKHKEPTKIHEDKVTAVEHKDTIQTFGPEDTVVEEDTIAIEDYSYEVNEVDIDQTTEGYSYEVSALDIDQIIENTLDNFDNKASQKKKGLISSVRSRQGVD